MYILVAVLCIFYLPKTAKSLNMNTLPPQYVQFSENELNDCNKAIELSPQYALAYNSRGQHYYHRENFDQAISDFNKAIELAPNNEMNFYYRGKSFAGKLQHKAALNDYTKAITINPNNTLFYNNRAFSYISLMEYQKAIADFQKSLEINPKQDPLIYFNLAQSFEIANLKSEALNYYQISFDKMPASARSYAKYRSKAQSRIENDWKSYSEWL